MKRALPVALLLLGCGSDPVAPDVEPIDKPDPSPYEPGTSTALAPSLTPDDMASLTPSAMARAAELDPQRVVAAYLALDAHADADCPSHRSDVTGPDGRTIYWDTEPCTTADGTYFQGFAQYQTFDEIIDDGVARSGVTLIGVALEIVATDGTWMRGGVGMEDAMYVTPDGNVAVYTVYYDGHLELDAATAAGNPWLVGDTSGYVALYAGDYQGTRELSISGALAWSSMGATAVQLDDLSVDAFACALGANGHLAVRDGAGAWHDAAFGDPESSDDPCDTCAELTFGVQTIGTFCADPNALTDLIAWETTPW